MSETKRLIDHTLPIDPPMESSERDSLEDAEMRMWAVQREEDAIIEEEGMWHVNGLYYGNSADASKMRFFEADRIVRERVRSRELEGRLLGRTA